MQVTSNTMLPGSILRVWRCGLSWALYLKASLATREVTRCGGEGDATCSFVYS